MPGHYFKMTSDGLECLNCDEDIWRNDEEEENGVKLKIDGDGLKLKINDNGEKAEVKIDEDGLRIK